MPIPADIQEYLQLHAAELGERILCSYPGLQVPTMIFPPCLHGCCATRTQHRPWPFWSEGLQVIEGDDDILTATARTVVENRGFGGSADSVGRRLCPAPALPSPEDSAETAIVTAEVETPEPLPLIADQIPNAELLEPVSLPRRDSRKGTEPPSIAALPTSLYMSLK